MGRDVGSRSCRMARRPAPSRLQASHVQMLGLRPAGRKQIHDVTRGRFQVERVSLRRTSWPPQSRKDPAKISYRDPTLKESHTENA